MNQSEIESDDYNIDGFYNETEPASIYERYMHVKIQTVSRWLNVTIGLVLMPVAIFAVSSMVKKDKGAPIYVINLLVSDVIQLCAMIILQTKVERTITFGDFMFDFALVASVGFMVCIALERYLLIVWPLWYRNRRTVKMSLLLCAVVWVLALFFLILHLVAFSNDWYGLFLTISGVFLLLPFPLLVFFLVGTFRALSASISVRAEEKRRIVGLLVLVLLIYTLLFLPFIIFSLVHPKNFGVYFVAYFFNELNPVADLFLYIFLRKGAVNQVRFCLCCCRKNRSTRQSFSGLNDGETVTSS
ncbi:mas-related G-protein coupled receptor member B3-like [Betta splendens]|uniref:Mas-related G-protein coupled receptor member B3-like n=1 Tax=Betta splendens TaxID=158456 RepID=A0A9W2XBF7_BETSP|nr:mas-related G-protein coupled receptor member B3-like [Betta splendens]XP_055359249.1 mas-related G-protein coupled receptor member B3-like [Betta splendens]